MTATTRRFIGARKMRDLNAAVRATTDAISDWETLRVRTAMGTKFRRTSRVVLRRPRWMPGWLYGRLLRSIVMELRDPDVDGQVADAD